MDIPVDVVGIYVDQTSNTSIVLLGDSAGPTRLLPIQIGAAEAQSIAIGLQHIETPRPLTHDLLLDVMEVAGVSIAAVTVTALEGGTFIAELGIESANSTANVSARPSDAIALAVRLGIQIQVESSVLDAAGMKVRSKLDGPFSAEEIERAIDEFQEFLATADSEDFNDSDGRKN